MYTVLVGSKDDKKHIDLLRKCFRQQSMYTVLVGSKDDKKHYFSDKKKQIKNTVYKGKGICSCVHCRKRGTLVTETPAFWEK